ncbi:MAG: DUF3611 family protein [Anaerolineae bacterium]|nr:DUF3611 family protein [Anaerolineae bacterium]
MPITSARYGFFFILIHWALVLMGVVLLGLGWYIQYVLLATPVRSFLLDLHMSLGLTSAIVLFIQIFLASVFKVPSFPNYFRKWRKLLAYTLFPLIYVSFTLMLVSGYFQAAFSALPMSFWGAPLPAWGEADATLAGLYTTVHGTAAFVLAGSIFVQVCFVFLNIFKHPGIAPRMLPGAPESHELVAGETKSPMASRKAQAFAKNLRLFGWFGFWIQFILVFVCGLLLAIAIPGRAFNPDTVGFGDSIYWSRYGFMLLCFAVLIAFYYPRVARKVASSPDSYFSRKSRTAFWFLSIGVLAGLLGAVISLYGLALSITLLLAKTVSIPPGIMMMNPTQIIRALDVLVLMVNLCLLMGHFIGTAISLWLSINVSRVHNAYMQIPRSQN